MDTVIVALLGTITPYAPGQSHLTPRNFSTNRQTPFHVPFSPPPYLGWKYDPSRPNMNNFPPLISQTNSPGAIFEASNPAADASFVEPKDITAVSFPFSSLSFLTGKLVPLMSFTYLLMFAEAHSSSFDDFSGTAITAAGLPSTTKFKPAAKPAARHKNKAATPIIIFLKAIVWNLS
jgi:hypothetical protein